MSISEEKEFNDPYERGIVTRTEDDDSLGYSFTTEFNFSIRKRKKEDMGKPIDDTEEPEEEDSEELKREKEHNKKYGVEIKQTFPFPEFDSGVPQEDEDNKGNKWLKLLSPSLRRKRKRNLTILIHLGIYQSMF